MSTTTPAPLNTTPNTPNQACCADGCCTPSTTAADLARADDLRDLVRTGYAQIARAGSWSATKPPATKPPVTNQQVAAHHPAPSACCTPTGSAGGCCGPTTFTPDQLALAIGYSADELAHAPDTANLGLSCGNPTALASLRPGETVLDLGSGAGFDCFIAGPKVGPTGRVIGVDMTPDMLTNARRNIATYTAHTGLNNVEFRLGEIESLPVPDATADVIISNCVLNLSPDKPRAWREIARALKPGGRVAVSDLALLQPLPPSIQHDLEALVGCVAGAELVADTHRWMVAAGLTDIALTSKPHYVDAMTDWQDPLYRDILAKLPPGSAPSNYITSLDITARKPAPSST